jgi:branched-chain amino acid transport system permease protein
MLAQQLVNGVMLGAVYALIAIGYTLIFGVLGMLHLAHGEVFMIGAFVGLIVLTKVSGNIILALAAAMLATGVLGLLIERIAFRAARRTPSGPAGHHDRRGHRAAGDRAVVLRSRAEGFPRASRSSCGDGPLRVSSVQVFILAAALVLMGAVHLFLSRTRAGRAVRATAEEPRWPACSGST